MCGRDYSTYTAEELSFRYFHRKGWIWNFDSVIPPFKPNYNMCPTQIGLILCLNGDQLQFKEMRWGLVPAWAKTVKDADKYSMTNAKSEEISEKRSYKAAFQKRRCIVPVSGFYEWKRDSTHKVPFAIRLKDQPVMSMAGIWERWSDGESAADVYSFAVITKAALGIMTNVHHRMPVILDQEQEQIWLNPETPLDEVNQTMLESNADSLEMFEVSPLVNSTRNNSPELLKAALPADSAV